MNIFLKDIPNFAPAIKDLIPYFPTLEDKLNAINEALSYNPDFETEFILKINMISLLHKSGDSENRDKLINEMKTKNLGKSHSKILDMMLQSIN